MAQNKSECQYVVYTMDGDGKPDHFLSVEEDAEDATEEMNRWWLAFRNGEKVTPNGYDGVSFRPVADFDRWKSPDDMNTQVQFRQGTRDHD